MKFVSSEHLYYNSLKKLIKTELCEDVSIFSGKVILPVLCYLLSDMKRSLPDKESVREIFSDEGKSEDGKLELLHELYKSNFEKITDRSQKIIFNKIMNAFMELLGKISIDDSVLLMGFLSISLYGDKDETNNWSAIAALHLMQIVASKKEYSLGGEYDGVYTERKVVNIKIEEENMSKYTLVSKDIVGLPNGSEIKISINKNNNQRTNYYDIEVWVDSMKLMLSPDLSMIGTLFCGADRALTVFFDNGTEKFRVKITREGDTLKVESGLNVEQPMSDEFMKRFRDFLQQPR